MKPSGDRELEDIGRVSPSCVLQEAQSFFPLEDR